MCVCVCVCPYAAAFLHGDFGTLMQSFCEAALQHASDAKLHGSLQDKGVSAAAFMLQSAGAGGSVHAFYWRAALDRFAFLCGVAVRALQVDVKLSADTAAWYCPAACLSC